MRKNIRKHFVHYLVYFVIFGGGLILVLSTRSNARVQALSIVLVGFLYFLWSMVHHYIHHQFTPRVVIEYILIVILGIILSLFLFQV